MASGQKKSLPDHRPEEEDVVVDDDGRISLEDLRSAAPSSLIVNSRPASPPPNRRLSQLKRLVEEEETCPLGELRRLAWNGVPSEVRAPVWQLMLGYLPAVKSRRESTLAKRRQDYRLLVEQFFAAGTQIDQATFHQVESFPL